MLKGQSYDFFEVIFGLLRKFEPLESLLLIKNLSVPPDFILTVIPVFDEVNTGTSSRCALALYKQIHLEAE
jgi:hypothetical protein